MESMTDCAFSWPISAAALALYTVYAVTGRRRRTLVVVDDVAQVVAAAVVRLADAHGVVRQVDIAVVACKQGLLARNTMREGQGVLGRGRAYKRLRRWLAGIRHRTVAKDGNTYTWASWAAGCQRVRLARQLRCLDSAKWTLRGDGRESAVFAAFPRLTVRDALEKTAHT